eukprot:CAMPEP_0198699788 /NCGR_PEP_ID=MMETSP1468-20131203/359365_1 /TAXON_ID=1461545 /ORGANISM="Mantoniella sp, Strain CCMP1436" /LENGTH=87 /DNA_ID=CAMNT_0044457427 /DNA_START=283 /DNA_END=546 /DNA_ORIENTATION=-
MSGIFGRVFGYVFNELLVNGLANSRTFQQFAVRTDKALREAKQSGKLGDPTQSATLAAKHASDFTRSMWEEVKTEAAELARKQSGKK